MRVCVHLLCLRRQHGARRPGYSARTSKQSFFPFRGSCENGAQMLLIYSNGRLSAAPLHLLSPESRTTHTMSAMEQSRTIVENQELKKSSEATQGRN